MLMLIGIGQTAKSNYSWNSLSLIWYTWKLYAFLSLSIVDWARVANHLNGWFRMFQKWGNLDWLIFTFYYIIMWLQSIHWHFQYNLLQHHHDIIKHTYIHLHFQHDQNARFIHTVCMHRIQWSCEGLTSVHNKYTGYSLKHLLLRHMYNLPLPMLKCYMLKPYALRLPTVDLYSAVGPGEMHSCNCAHTVLCGVLYTACVDASRTVFWDRSVLR